MRKTRICIIDEQVNLETLSRLIPKNIIGLRIVQHENVKITRRFSHGTLCAAILIESLIELGIEKDCEITHFSIDDMLGDRSFQGFMSALEYCCKNQFDFIAISIGVLSRTYADQMVQYLDELNAIVFAAASNQFEITYPAALPQVVGVARCQEIPQEYIQIVEEPFDGIELYANFASSAIIEKIWGAHNTVCTNSNSVLVPRICAKAAKIMIEKGEMLTKEDLLRKLNSDEHAKVNKEILLHKVQSQNHNEALPTVLLTYSAHQKESALSQALLLQDVFIRLEYSCAIISDLLDRSNFIKGLFRLEAPGFVEYYQKVITDGLLLVLVRNELVGAIKGDLIVTQWIKERVDMLSARILHAFEE